MGAIPLDGCDHGPCAELATREKLPLGEGYSLEEERGEGCVPCLAGEDAMGNVLLFEVWSDLPKDLWE